jgi:hypothetical protein
MRYSSGKVYSSGRITAQSTGCCDIQRGDKFRPGAVNHAKGSWAVTETPGTSDYRSSPLQLILMQVTPERPAPSQPNRGLIDLGSHVHAVRKLKALWSPSWFLVSLSDRRNTRVRSPALVFK